MVFSSPVFLFIFLTSVYILYRIIPTITAKNILLLIFSLAFYTYGEPKAIVLMIISIIINYVFGLAMNEKNTYRKIFLAISITINLLMLGIFKYAGFGAEMLDRLPFLSMNIPNIALPIGISFYTFQAMSYVIDAYKNPTYIQKNPYKLALYITFFPQLVAGPIVKYYDFADQIDHRKTTPKKTAQGIRRFITGLSKKLLIANTMAVTADFIYGLDTENISAPLAWLGAFSYMMQIFFDFSGYSDMAIGLGKMFGFDFSENFNYPYISESMQEFWRRWHISVSTWFKEYLYIPLGGNRKGKVRTAFNKLFVFFCTGLWHGASLNFIVWGLINGAFMMLESYKIINTEKWLKPFRHAYTLLVTLLAFVFFRADDISTACAYIGKMFSFSGGTPENNSVFMIQFTPMYVIMTILACIFSAPVWQTIRSRIKSEKILSAGEVCSYVASLVMLMLCILTLSSTSYNPFIYFRF
ncbi:MAG: MBOAT family protein [Prevotella sp.]|nr:MBOAT family protein [Alistipes senegalensis]MCM1357321.1 MBOAT family protein [Prevotella sp.]MCM1472764.1 MBOAT family protein [Muribaculaceae bacterium]